MGIDAWAFVISVIAVCVAIAAGAYTRSQAISAKSQANSAEAQLALSEQLRREANEPYVVVDFEIRGGGIYLVIQNAGPTVARNVRISVSPELESTLDGNHTELLQQIVRRVIPTMPPGRRLEFLFDVQMRVVGDLPTAYEFQVNADGPMGPVTESRYIADLAIFRDSIMQPERYDGILKEFKGLHKEVEAFRRLFGKAHEEAIYAANDREREYFERLRPGRQVDAPSEDSGPAS